MKALVLEAYNVLTIRNVPDPVCNDDEVLIKVKACGICGSDVHGLDGSTGRRIPPLIMGHEASGIVEVAGKNVTKWRAGDRVTFDSTVYRLDDWYTLEGLYNISDNREVLGVSPGNYRRNGAFAEYVAVPQHILYRIPDNVTFEQAALTEAVAVALHAVNLSAIKTGEKCAVTGAGTIGISIIKLLKISGASKIIAIDIDPVHSARAMKAGADKAISATGDKVEKMVMELTGGRGADISFEAVGKSESVNTAINVLRKGGRCVLVGNTSPHVNFPLQKVVTGELKILGSCAIRGEYEAVLDLIGSGRLQVNDMISAVAPLSEGAEWFGRLQRREGNLNKVILVP